MSFILGEIGDACDGTAAFLGAATIACKSAYDGYSNTQDRHSLIKNLQIVLCSINSIMTNTDSEEVLKYIKECEQHDNVFYFPAAYSFLGNSGLTK